MHCCLVAEANGRGLCLQRGAPVPVEVLQEAGIKGCVPQAGRVRSLLDLPMVSVLPAYISDMALIPVQKAPPYVPPTTQVSPTELLIALLILIAPASYGNSVRLLKKDSFHASAHLMAFLIPNFLLMVEALCCRLQMLPRRALGLQVRLLPLTRERARARKT